MKKLVIILLLAITTSSFAQIFEPVKWSTSVEKVSDTEYKLIAKARPLERVDNYLRNEYVLISLYVDDKKELPEDEKIEVNRINGGTRLLKNYGHKWANFQTQFFKSNSQPYYVLLSSDGKQMLTELVGYTPDEDEYHNWLKEGVSNFKK